MTLSWARAQRITVPEFAFDGKNEARFRPITACKQRTNPEGVERACLLQPANLQKWPRNWTGQKGGYSSADSASLVVEQAWAEIRRTVRQVLEIPYMENRGCLSQNPGCEEAPSPAQMTVHRTSSSDKMDAKCIREWLNVGRHMPFVSGLA